MLHALDALGNPMRRSILLELRKRPLSVHEIAKRLPISRPAVSRHLRLLEETGLVDVREEGRNNIYSIRLKGFASVKDFVDDFWDSALSRLEALSKS